MTRHTHQPVRALTTAGLQILTALEDWEATQIGRHWNAVRRYLEYGDVDGLYQMPGTIVAGHELETNIDAVEWHAVRGEISFESIYEEVI